MNHLQKILQPEPLEMKPVESKKEHELTNEDRMYLMNKKLDTELLVTIYTNLMIKKQYMDPPREKFSVDVNEYVFSDIEMLADSYGDLSKSVIAKLDHCKTSMGSLLFRNLIQHPVHDIQLLQSRQNIIRKFANIRADIAPLLEEIRTLENNLIWFWNDVNRKHIDSMNDLIYFNYDIIPFFNCNELLNNNEKALLITNIYKIFVSPLLTILTPLLSLLVPLILMLYAQRKLAIKIPAMTVIKQYFSLILGMNGSMGMNMIFQNQTKARMATLFTQGLYLFMYFQNIYYSCQSASNTNKIINIIHGKLNTVASYLKATGRIQDICEGAQITDLHPFLEYASIEEDCAHYRPYFDGAVFESEPCYFSNKGRILTTYKRFAGQKENMESIFHYTGIIDAISSIDSLLANSNGENPYSYITFLPTRNRPQFESTGLWHPYLEKSVKNDVSLKHNMLITGPNAAGKSTFIKSVVIALLLGQTIGITSSEKTAITPFRLMETYLHIPDSKGEASLFEAEMHRSKRYIDKLAKLEKHHFSFIVLDEIFSSTNYVEGFSGAYSILRKIASFKNALSITTTHYSDLERLEKDTKGKIVNYKFDVDYGPNKEILFNYILKKGSSRQYIALDLLQKNGFDEDILDMARKMSATLVGGGGGGKRHRISKGEGTPGIERPQSATDGERAS